MPNLLLTYTYDNFNNVLSVIDNFGVVVDSSYDNRDLLLTRSWSGGVVDAALAEFDYDARGQRTETRRFSDLTATNLVARSTFDYDARRRTTDIQNLNALDEIFADHDYSYDNAGRIASEIVNGLTIDYSYDFIGQLADVVRSDSQNESYTYDVGGNRVSAGNVVGPGNRLLSDGTFDYQYDAEGNRIKKTELATGEFTEYEFDHRGRLVSATTKSSGGIILSESSYTYDAFDRRIAKTVDVDGVGSQTPETEVFVYNGTDIWADFDPTGNVAARYLIGSGTDELITRWRPGESSAWYLTDRLGTVRDLLDANGAIINRIVYDSFGNIQSQTNAAVADRFLFTGREFDAELGQYYYRARYYDANTGRFTTQDPLGFLAGDTNLYRYVMNSPAQFRDPSGQLALAEFNSMLCNVLDAASSGIAIGEVIRDVFSLRDLLVGLIRPPFDPRSFDPQALICASASLA